jgi:hypothetical protein
MRVQVFGNVKLRRLVKIYRRFERSNAFSYRFKHSKKTAELQVKELQLIETSGIFYPESFNFQLRKFFRSKI